MIDDTQKARPHKIDGKIVETKRAMPKEVCFIAGQTRQYQTLPLIAIVQVNLH